MDCRPPAGALGHGHSEAHSFVLDLLGHEGGEGWRPVLLFFCRKRTDVASLLFLTPGERRLRPHSTPVFDLQDFGFTSTCCMPRRALAALWASFTLRNARLLWS